MPLTYNSLRAPLVARNYHPAHLHLIRHPFNTTQSENKQSILLKEVPYTESVSKPEGYSPKFLWGYSSQNSKPLSTAPCPNWPREPRKTNTWLTERTKGTSTRHAFSARCSTDGNETWCTYMRQEHRLNSFHLQCLKRILGVKWQDHVTNSEIQSRAGTPACTPYSVSAAWDGWGMVITYMDDGRISKKVL